MSHIIVVYRCLAQKWWYILSDTMSRDVWHNQSSKSDFITRINLDDEKLVGEKVKFIHQSDIFEMLLTNPKI